MAQQVFKISGSTQVKLITIGDRINLINSLTIANIHDTAAAAVDLFLANPTDNYYIFKNLSIPAGQTLKLESNEVSFDNKVYNLYIKLGAASSVVDVILK
jgi:hypothetical protein